MGSISHHIAPLVISSLGGGHTHTHKHIYRRPHRNNFKKPGMRRPQASAPEVAVIYNHNRAGGNGLAAPVLAGPFFLR